MSSDQRHRQGENTADTTAADREDNQRHSADSAPQTAEVPLGYIVPIQSDAGAEIDLGEMWRILWQRRIVMIAVPLAVGLLAVVYSLSLSDVFRGDVLLAPVSIEETNRGALGGLGGLASLAGLSVSATGDSEEILAILQSREFLWRFIESRSLMPVLFADEWDEEGESWRIQGPPLASTKAR